MRKSVLCGLALLALLAIMAPSAGPVHAQPTSEQQFSVSTRIDITPNYDVYGSGSGTINATIAGPITPTTGQSITIYTGFPGRFNGSEVSATGASKLINCTLIEVGTTGEYQGVLDLSYSYIAFTVSAVSQIQGSSWLWHYLSGAPIAELSNVPATYTTTVAVPRGSLLSQVYSGGGASLAVPTPTISAGLVTYSFTSNSNAAPNSLNGVPSLLVIQSTAFVPASIAVTAVGLAIVALAAFGYFSQGEKILKDIYADAKSGLSRLFGLIPGLRGRSKFRFRSLFLPKKLLALFILCALVMVAIGALSGPDPRLKAYVIADNNQIGQIQSELASASGNPNVLVMTPTEDYSDFNVMSSVGQFNVAVVGNYSSAELADVQGFVLPYLGNVPVIVVQSGSSSFASDIIREYPTSQVIAVGNATSMTSAEMAQLSLYLTLSQRTNILGLHLGVTEFKLVIATEAVLSMVLVLFGWAYIGSLTSETRAKTDVSHLATIIAMGVFVFVFSEVVYVVTSSTLALPLSLHAVNSDAHDLTAIGILGFGGGSTPRLLVGVVGVLIGAVGVEEGLRVSKKDFALIGGLLILLFANPLAIGQFVFETIVLFAPTTLVFGPAYASSLTLKGFIYGFGAALGGEASPTYLLSAGKILFFAGLVPLAYIKRMGRTTTAIALLFVALMVGDGGVRVGEMTPDKTVVAILPGLVAGFAFAAVLLALALVERYVRGNWRSRA